jgi:hypothetical protein
MTQPKMLTAQDLAGKAGITPAKLRRLLRNKFNRAGKAEVGQKRMEYRFDPNDPLVKQIVAQVKGKPADKEKDAQKKAPAKGQPKTQKPKATKSEASDKSVQKGGESDDNKAANN